MKSEPDAYGIDDLRREGTTLWDGIRNYQARNFMRSMRTGDQAFFYHSNCKPPGIVGLMEVIETGLVDPTQFDPKSKYFDAKSPEDDPRWLLVDVAPVEALPRFVTLADLKGESKLEEMLVVQRGQRLSVQPVTPAEWRLVRKMGGL